MPSHTRNGVLFAASVIGIASAASGAIGNPQYTTVNPAPAAEKGHLDIFASMYGGTWVFDGVDATNGVWSALRFTDYGSPLGVGLESLSPKISRDDIWSSIGGMDVTITTKAKFAGDGHVLGWIDDTLAEPVFQPILSSASSSTSVAVPLPSNFRWALMNTTSGRMFTSRSLDNPGAGVETGELFDQLVTYHVTGPNGQSEIALFWEDRIGGQSADYDYNDAVFALSVIPAPGTGVLAVLGLIGLASRRRHR